MKAKLRRQKNKMMFHTLENCECGTPRHNPTKIKKWNKQWAKVLKSHKRKEKKRISKNKLTKSPVIEVGMEYKDRHSWKKLK